jgi:transcriptional regulator with XRE-family HTH domain
MGMSQTAVSTVLSGERKPGWDFCAEIAKVFGEPPERIFRLTGLLPPQPSQGQNEDQLLATYRQLPIQQQDFIISMLRGLQGPSNGPVTVIRERGEHYTVLIDEGAVVPTDEDIMDALTLLDEPERIFVYDYIQWRLSEQRNRRDSSGRRLPKRRTKEERRLEWSNTIQHIDYYLTFHEVSQVERDRFIADLRRLGEQREALEKGNDRSVVEPSPFSGPTRPGE